MAMTINQLIYEIVDIFRTTPINAHYPHGFDCNICDICGNECTCETEGYECNVAFYNFIKKQLTNREIIFDGNMQIKQEGDRNANGD